MNILVILLYLFIPVTFALVVMAYGAQSQAARQRYLKIYIFFEAVLVAYYIVVSFGTDIPYFLPFFLAFGICWPALVARLSVWARLKSPPLVVAKRQTYYLVWGIIGICAVVGMSFFLLIPTQRDVITHAPVYSVNHIVPRVGFFLAFVPLMGVFLFTALQKTSLYEEQMLHNGMLWAWSDFQNYTWVAHADARYVILVLNTKYAWLRDQIKVEIAAADQRKADELLARQLILSKV